MAGGESIPVEGINELSRMESSLRRRLAYHLKALGYERDENHNIMPPSSTKEAFRSLHRKQRIAKLQESSRFIKSGFPRLSSYFASGCEVTPSLIEPKLELVRPETFQADLFRLASLTWSVPVSSGYGRRMRFLVWDESIHKIMGIIALGDPVFNLRVRDQLIGWNAEDRKERLVNMMDAYVLGSLPPYNFLLGGKLVASLVRSKEVRRAFLKKYSGKTGIISQKVKKADLAMVTTSSALGASSVYDRLKLADVTYFDPIGFTSGWGHFHVPDNLFEDMRIYLEKRGHAYSHNHQFGDGPNWRIRVVRVALELLGLNPDMLRHGINREVFVCRLADNAEDYLHGDSRQLHFSNLLSVKEVGDLALTRWIIPRASRRLEYQSWKNDMILELLDYRKDGSASLKNGTLPNTNNRHTLQSTIGSVAPMHAGSLGHDNAAPQFQEEIHVPED